MALTVPSSSTTAAFGTPSTGITVAKPSGTTTGDVLYAFISKTLYADTTAFSCSGWVWLSSGLTEGQVTENDLHATLLRKVISNGGSEPANYTFVAAGGDASMVGIILRVAGADNAQPEDPTTGASPAIGFTNNTSNSATINRTTTFDGSMALQYSQMSLGASAAKTWGPPVTYSHGADDAETSTGTTNNQSGVDYRTFATAGTATGSSAFTHTPSDLTSESLRMIVMVKAGVPATRPIAIRSRF